jgi:hypothetical protein
MVFQGVPLVENDPDGVEQATENEHGQTVGAEGLDQGEKKPENEPPHG